MLGLTLRALLRGPARPTLLALGLAVLTGAALLGAGASRSSAVAVDRDLTRYWRTTYDILVRPPGARSPVEERHGLVEANHLSGIRGGITFAQYEAIRGTPGVEVAAPIAMLGYLALPAPADDLPRPVEPGAYVRDDSLVVDDGARVRHLPVSTRYYYFGPGERGAGTPEISVNPPGPLSGEIQVPLLLAAIDPPQEAALVGLDRALRRGRYLTGRESLHPVAETGPFGDRITVLTVPILINATPYARVEVRSDLHRALVPPGASSLQAITGRGGVQYLDSLPRELVASSRVDGGEAYRRLVDGVLEDATGTGYTASSILHSFAQSVPGRIRYRSVRPPLPWPGPILEVVPPDRAAGWFGEPAYRSSPDPFPLEPAPEARFRAHFILHATGVFDLGGIPRPADLNRVPLETYFPPTAILRYDGAGRPVPPRALRPTLSPAGYLQSPPLMLTTLRAARALRGEDAISAVRVRVGDIDRLTPTAQRKIEAVASEIVARTGLTVDVMVGSSPRRVLVRVPGVGYVEEGWIQKGVTVSFSERVQAGHLLVLATLLGIGGLFALDLSWGDVVARRGAIALCRALGWRSRTVFRQVVGRAVLLGSAGAGAGLVLAWALAGAAGWRLPRGPLVGAVPVAVVALVAVGALYPAWLASRVPPVGAMREARVGHRRVTRRAAASLWSYARHGLGRRRRRVAVAGAGAALAAALVVLLLAVTVDRQGYLTGTLLGEFILVRIERFHFVLAALGLGLSTGAMGSTLLGGVVERRSEIGVLKAVGWRTGAVARLFLAEGIVLGTLGGVAGSALAMGASIGVFRTWSWSVVWVGLVGTALPAFLGVAAAAYPARVAAAASPADALVPHDG